MDWLKTIENKKTASIVLFVFSFLLYANTLGHQYALDDKIVITENNFTKNGINGIADIFKNDSFVGFFGRQKNLVEGGRYRPLSIAVFAVIWQGFGPNSDNRAAKSYQTKINRVAFISHCINVLLYSLTSIVLYLFFCQLLKDKMAYAQLFSFCLVMLYACHPLHTEVVANIKSMDEVLGVLLGFSALWLGLRYFDGEESKLLLWVGLLFALSLFSKESSVTLLGVGAISIFLFRNWKVKRFVWTLTPLFLGLVVYLFCRRMALGVMEGDIAPELMNDPFILAKSGEKWPSVFYTFVLYYKLLVLPLNLTHDYYPWYPIAKETYMWSKPFPYLKWSHPGALFGLLSFLLLLGLSLKALVGRFRGKENDLFGYAILLFVGTFILFSNLLFSIGTFMNERFMYIPSLGFSVLVCVLLFGVFKKNPKKVLWVLMPIVLFFSMRTIARNPVWENDYTLASNDYKVSTTSAKANMSAAGQITEEAKKQSNPSKKKKMLKEAISCGERAIGLYPTYSQAYVVTGIAYYENESYIQCIDRFATCLKYNPNFTDASKNLLAVAQLLKSKEKIDEAILALERYLPYDQKNIQVYSLLGECYGRYKQNLSKAGEYLNKGLTLAPNNIDLLQKMGVVYASAGNANKALETLLKADSIQPNDSGILKNIAATYYNTGNLQMAQFYNAKSEKAK